MLLHGGETPNVEKDSNESSLQHGVEGFPKPGGHDGPSWLQNNRGQYPWNVEGRALSALSRFGESVRTISDPLSMQRITQQHAIMEPQSDYFVKIP